MLQRRLVVLALLGAVVVAVLGEGFAGLRNQGNTCYLNSLLQTLYHCPPFREAVLERSPKGFRRRFGVTKVGALAKVFERLQKNKTAETRGLTKALGVDPREQRDPVSKPPSKLRRACLSSVRPHGVEIRCFFFLVLGESECLFPMS